MRIIAGALKGRRLETPDWPGLRPTSDKLRETLFNVLMARVAGARVLDGYAGTGAVGIEALSRGAAHVTFVEADTRAARLIARNLERCAVGDRYAIIRARFADAAPRWPGGMFDLVLLDPPYGQDDLARALGAAAPLVSAGGLLVLEHARRDRAPGAVAALTKLREISSGDSALSLYAVQEASEGEAGAT
jgi:16S rRNA (guanine(966)-N(2))-methyltransferase RsmD